MPNGLGADLQLLKPPQSDTSFRCKFPGSGLVNRDNVLVAGCSTTALLIFADLQGMARLNLSRAIVLNSLLT